MMPVMGIADGPTEVHKVTIARQVLKRVPAVARVCSRARTSRRGGRQRAARFAELLEHEVAQL